MKWLGSATSAGDLGRDFGATLTESEVRYLMTHEWARSAEDIVWRRSKLGLRLSPEQIAAIDRWMAENAGTASRSPVKQAGARS